MRPGVGIVGYGRFGRSLHLAWGEQVAALCDRARIEAPEFPARTYTDPAALLEDPDVSIVSVATEPATHAALAVEALKAGKHVIVEKPLALTMEDARRHVAPTGHWFWDEARSGGILVEHGVHFFELAAQLARSPARDIAAFRQVRADGRADGMAATIVHRNGAIAHHAHVFCRSAEAERTAIDLGFEHGSVTLTGWIPLEGEVWADPSLETLERIEALLPGYRLIRHATFPAIRARFSLNQSKQEAYRASLRALLQNLQAAADGRESLVVSVEEAASALETALLATDAARADLTGNDARRGTERGA